jgi:hypothetical protein
MENENSENGAFISTNPLFRNLTAEEVEEFRVHARENFTPESAVNPVWHPVYRHECDRISAEARADREEKWSIKVSS